MIDYNKVAQILNEEHRKTEHMIFEERVFRKEAIRDIRNKLSDYFIEVDKDFDPDKFYRTCSLGNAMDR